MIRALLCSPQHMPAADDADALYMVPARECGRGGTIIWQGKHASLPAELFDGLATFAASGGRLTEQLLAGFFTGRFSQ